MKNINHILEKIRKGDREAFDFLLHRHHKMIYKLINSYNLENGDYAIDPHDLYQEGCIALYNSVFTFEKERNVKFSTYAYLCINGAIRKCIRENAKRYLEEPYSLDVVRKIKLELIVEDNPLNYHHEEECRRKLDEFMKDLNSEDLKIIELRRRDMSYKQIAESLNINAKRVDNRIQVLRKRLRKDLYDQEGGI